MDIASHGIHVENCEDFPILRGGPAGIEETALKIEGRVFEVSG